MTTFRGDFGAMPGQDGGEFPDYSQCQAASHRQAVGGDAWPVPGMRPCCGPHV